MDRHDPEVRDLMLQFRSAADANTKLHDRIGDLRVRVLSYVEQGEGLTQQELVELYARVDAIIPRRVRRPGAAATPEQERVVDEVRSL